MHAMEYIQQQSEKKSLFLLQNSHKFDTMAPLLLFLIQIYEKPKRFYSRRIDGRHGYHRYPLYCWYFTIR